MGSAGEEKRLFFELVAVTEHVDDMFADFGAYFFAQVGYVNFYGARVIVISGVTRTSIRAAEPLSVITTE